MAADYERSAAMWRSGPDLVYRQLARVLVDMAPFPLAGARVLDIGAGTGALSAVLHAAGASAFAVDASAGMLCGARRAVATLRAIAADARHLPLSDGSFDASFAGFVLNHLDAPYLALAEAARVTRPGGAVMAMTFSAGDDNRAKSAVDAVARRWGWEAPGWYEVQKRWAQLTDSPAGLLYQAERAGLGPSDVSRLDVDAGLFSARQLVSWRLGHAHLAPFATQLADNERRRLISEAEASIGAEPQRLQREVLVLSSQARA